MESFLVAVNAVIPFFCYLALGYTMKIRGVVSEEFLQKLNQMVFRVFYPFMTFYNIYKADAESLPRPLLLIFTGASILIVGGDPDRDRSEDRKGEPEKRRYHSGNLPKQLRIVRTPAHDRSIRRLRGIYRRDDGNRCRIDLQHDFRVYS